MDRGKRKMTADDIASKRHSELRNSRIARGEGLRLQPSAEFLNARYVGPTENMWTVSATMPTIFPQPVSTVHPMTLPTSGPIPIWTANPWTTSPSVPVPMGFAPQTTIGSTTTIPTSCPLLPNSLLQEMEHLNMFAPRTVHDIRSELYKGLRDVSSQSVSPWTVPSSAYAPTSSMFQATDVTPCNSQASIPMSASSVSSQQIKQLTVTPQPLPIDGDQSWDCYITPSMIKPVPSWPFGAMGRPCFCEGSWHFIVADDGREAYLDERSFLRIMSRGGFKYERRGRMQIPGKHR